MLQLARRSANVTHRLRSAEEWRNLFASALPDALFGCLAGADEEVALSVMHALEHMVAGPAEELATARSVVDAPRAADAPVAAMNGHPANVEVQKRALLVLHQLEYADRVDADRAPAASAAVSRALEARSAEHYIGTVGPAVLICMHNAAGNATNHEYDL